MYNFSRYLTVAALISLPAVAQAEIGKGFFMGGGLKHSAYKLEEDDSKILDDDFVGAALSVGYFFTDNLGLELSHHRYATEEQSLDENETLENELDITTLGVLINLPTAGGWNVQFGVGAGDYNVDHLVKEAGESDERFSSGGKGFYYRVGASYDLFEHLSLGLTYSGHQFDDDDLPSDEDVEGKLSETSLNVIFQF